MNRAKSAKRLTSGQSPEGSGSELGQALPFQLAATLKAAGDRFEWIETGLLEMTELKISPAVGLRQDDIRIREGGLFNRDRASLLKGHED